jgi:hypothetical protein
MGRLRPPPRSDADAEDAKARCVEICSGCPCLAACASWADTTAPRERSGVGVLAGVVWSPRRRAAADLGRTMPQSPQDQRSDTKPTALVYKPRGGGLRPDSGDVYKMAAMDRPILPEYLDQPTIEDRLAALANAINSTPKEFDNE